MCWKCIKGGPETLTKHGTGTAQRAPWGSRSSSWGGGWRNYRSLPAAKLFWLHKSSGPLSSHSTIRSGVSESPYLHCGGSSQKVHKFCNIYGASMVELSPSMERAERVQHLESQKMWRSNHFRETDKKESTQKVLPNPHSGENCCTSFQLPSVYSDKTAEPHLRLLGKKPQNLTGQIYL